MNVYLTKKALAIAVIIELVVFSMLAFGLMYMVNMYDEVLQVADEALNRNFELLDQNKQLVEENSRLNGLWLEAEYNCLKSVVQVCCDDGGYDEKP